MRLANPGREEKRNVCPVRKPSACGAHGRQALTRPAGRRGSPAPNRKAGFSLFAHPEGGALASVRPNGGTLSTSNRKARPCSMPSRKAGLLPASTRKARPCQLPTRRWDPCPRPSRRQGSFRRPARKRSSRRTRPFPVCQIRIERKFRPSVHEKPPSNAKSALKERHFGLVCLICSVLRRFGKNTLCKTPGHSLPAISLSDRGIVLAFFRCIFGSEQASARHKVRSRTGGASLETP